VKSTSLSLVHDKTKLGTPLGGALINGSQFECEANVGCSTIGMVVFREIGRMASSGDNKNRAQLLP
jgi:hypothetical protein